MKEGEWVRGHWAAGGLVLIGTMNSMRLYNNAGLASGSPTNIDCCNIAMRYPGMAGERYSLSI